MAHNPKYPRCWLRVSRIIRRLAHGHCEHCHHRYQMWELSIHHLGLPYANGSPGDPSDKHDIRRENQVALCWNCHRAAERPSSSSVKSARPNESSTRV